MSSGCEVAPGSGSVARRGDSLAWASEDTPDLVWDTLLSCLALGERAHGAGPILHALAQTLPADVAGGAAFAVLVTDGSSGFVLRHGPVEVRLDGSSPAGGVVTPVTVAGRTVVVGHPDAVQALAERPSSPRQDLRDGTVSGAAFRWSAGAAPEPPAPVGDQAPDQAPDNPAPDNPAPDPAPEDQAPGAGQDRPTRLSGPAVDIADAPAEPTSDAEQTEFHPAPAAEPTSGAELPAAGLPRTGGALVFADGSTVTLTGDVVLGRRPERHDLVTGGQAQPMVIHDPENVLSSAHAAVRIQGDEVVVVDLDSLNGTHVAAPEDRDWTRLSAGAPYPIQDGDRMLLGWTVLTYRRHPA